MQHLISVRNSTCNILVRKTELSTVNIEFWYSFEHDKQTVVILERLRSLEISVIKIILEHAQ
jgi:hypothetical protein